MKINFNTILITIVIFVILVFGVFSVIKKTFWPEKINRPFADQVISSCLIEKDNQCFDYIGQDWEKEKIANACPAEGIISVKPCLDRPLNGGCRSLIGSDRENISWFYQSGDRDKDNRNQSMQRDFCELLPQSQWIEPQYI